MSNFNWLYAHASETPPLFRALRQSHLDLKKVLSLVQAHPESLCDRDGEGKTPLHWAAAYQYLQPQLAQAAEILITHASESVLRMQDRMGTTAFALIVDPVFKTAV